MARELCPIRSIGGMHLSFKHIYQCSWIWKNMIISWMLLQIERESYNKGIMRFKLASFRKTAHFNASPNSVSQNTPFLRLFPFSKLKLMGFALWIDTEQRVAWARGTHEYRPMGTAVIALTDRFRHRDFRQTRSAPRRLRACFVGFFGSLETVNEHLHSGAPVKPRVTPSHLL